MQRWRRRWDPTPDVYNIYGRAAAFEPFFLGTEKTTTIPCTAATIPFNIGDTTVLIYKVVEIGTVTEDEIEKILNNWSAKGWNFDGLQFAMRDSSKRPAMAFALFTQNSSCEEEQP